MIRLPRAVRFGLGLCLISLLNPWEATAQVELVEGRELTLYEIDDPHGRLHTPDLGWGGFSQRVLWWRGSRRLVAVEVHLEPYVSRDGLPSPSDWTGIPLDLASRLAGPGLTRAEALRRIVDWLGTEIVYRPPTTGEETAAWALEGRVASCRGRTALACSLAERLGIPARPVRGILVGQDPVFHRWPSFELQPGRWVQADPGLSLDFVDSRHLVAWVESDLPGGPYLRPAELGIRIRPVRREDDRVITDQRPSSGDFLARRSDRLQRTGALVVQLDRDRDWSGWGLALEGAAGRVEPSPVGDGGRASFAGLGGGTYRLTALEPTLKGFEPRSSRRITLSRGQLMSLEWSLEEESGG